MSPIKYALFSELPKEVQQKILGTATEHNMISGYRLPVSNNEYFSPSNEELLVAMRGNELLGSMRFALEKHGGHTVVNLGRLFVEPSWRKKGVGSKLYLHMKSLAERKLKLPLRGVFTVEALRIKERAENRPTGKGNGLAGKIKSGRKMKPR